MNAVDLAAKMEWMIDNYSAAIEMGEKAREFAVEHFDIDKVAMRYEEYYCQLAGKPIPVINSNQTVVA
jgi:glycosyltransferase involved in cell wall biosynthesis